jgi:hypothetical protein
MSRKLEQVGTKKKGAGFERQAWPHLRANFLEERRRAAAEHYKQALRARGDYTF